jgi:hypothetical protein
MKNNKSILALMAVTLMVGLSGCGTMTKDAGLPSGVSPATISPNPASIYYVDYSSPSNDRLLAGPVYTVTPGSNLKLYRDANLLNKIGEQAADSNGRFTFDLGDNVAANDTVYLVVTESGKQPSPAVAFSR